MINIPTDIKDFVKLKPWWRTPVPTDIVLSEDGIADLFTKLSSEGKKEPFFIIDSALEKQGSFDRIFAKAGKFIFNASESEPRTCDVDSLVTHIKKRPEKPDVLVGIGGGATMDLAKATGICLANPKRAQDYQGYGLDMKKGTDIWVVPALNGTGAEITPIAVLRGPEKKLGINNPYTESSVAIIDPQLSAGAKKFNRFFTMMDCYYHHYEITKSHTSSKEAMLDAEDGLRLSKAVLSNDLTEYCVERAIKSAMASILGGSSTIGGRVGIPHAISYGLSNSAPHLPHSVAVTISMLALEDIYPDGYADTINFLDINGMNLPKASDYGIGDKDLEKMLKTALGMDKLWQSAFGMEEWQNRTTPEFITDIYKKIINA
jgi:3-deoxy-alpha-D-manno-octulosonate 8-oxidase